jgi:hypothetical protein
MEPARTLTTSAPSPLTRAERRLASLLRLFAVLFAVGAIGFFVRPDGTVGDMNRVGALLGLGILPVTGAPTSSDFWLVLAIANMTTIAACAALAAQDVRGRRVLIYPLLVSKLTSSGTGLVLFLTRGLAFPFLGALLVDLPIAIVLWAALRAADAERAR